MMFTQSYVNSMVDAIEHMRITPRQKDHARAVMRAAIEFANARHGMHASKQAQAAAHTSQHEKST